MKNFLLALLAFLIWAAFALIFHQYASNSICDNCTTTHSMVTNDETQTIKEEIIKEPVVEKTSKTLFSITSADGTSLFNFSKGFTIHSNNGDVTIPNELETFKDSIYNYLNAYQDKELHISTKYLNSEIDSITGVNFGNTRANFLKDILTKSGINPDKIVLDPTIAEFNYDENGDYFDGISMQFQNANEQRKAEIEKGIANKTLYSDFAIKDFKPDRTLTAYTIELKNYLVKYPDKKVYVEGHTDSIGNNNYAFGMDRANNVKNYLISQGIDPNIIIVSSKGETEPVATNTTEEGKAKNRRIEITIK